jgi:hypothetical protein
MKTNRDGGGSYKKPFDKEDSGEKKKEYEESRRKEIEIVDSTFGFEKYEESIPRDAFLLNIKTVTPCTK